MSNQHEVERIKQVYGRYQGDAHIQAQWDNQNPGNQAVLAERQTKMGKLLQKHGFYPLRGLKVLEVGCGSGNVLARLTDLGAFPDDLYGVDLLPERIAAAKQKYPDIHFDCVNGEQLEFADGAFDLVLVFTVFSSILDQSMAHNVAREISRVLKPGGTLLWYDFRFNNPRNAHVQGMGRQHIQQLFPTHHTHLQTITVLPPLVRRLGRWSTQLYPLLAYIPWLRTHYIGLLQKSI